MLIGYRSQLIFDYLMEDIMTRKTLLSSPEAAAYLGLRDQTLRKKRMTGDGPRYIRLGGRRGKVCYSEQELENWLNARTFASTSEETVTAAAEGKRKY